MTQKKGNNQNKPGRSQNSFTTLGSKDRAENLKTTSARPSSNGSMKDSHAQVPDDSPNRSGPGGD